MHRWQRVEADVTPSWPILSATLKCVWHRSHEDNCIVWFVLRTCFSWISRVLLGHILLIAATNRHQCIWTLKAQEYTSDAGILSFFSSLKYCKLIFIRLIIFESQCSWGLQEQSLELVNTVTNFESDTQWNTTRNFPFPIAVDLPRALLYLDCNIPSLREISNHLSDNEWDSHYNEY